MQQVIGMEGLRKKKTIYLETLENLFQELTQARSISSGGRKLILLGLLYDVHRVHQFFKQIENNLSESIDIHDILLSDVDYNEWSIKLDIKFDVKAFYMPDEEEKDADAASVKATLWHVFDTFSREELKDIICNRTENVKLLTGVLMNDLNADQLAIVLNESIVALRENLLYIHACISKHRISSDECKELYRHEREVFIKGYECRVIEEFEDWKENSCDGNEAVIKRNLKGKYCTEMLAFFMSEFLASRISAQAETDTTEFDAEFAELRFYNVPKDTDVKAHYSALRELFDYENKAITPNKVSIGRYFFKHRKEVDAKQRVALFKFIKMIELIEEEKKPRVEDVELNYEGIKIYMSREVFPKCRSILCDGYDETWLNDYMTALMNSEYRDDIAKKWAIKNKRNTVVGNIIGVLILTNVIKGSKRAIGKLLNEEESGNLSRYMSGQKTNPITDWTKEYIEGK